MNQVESVAFWVGLIGSIVGIVLSIVAIVFSILVDRRSSKISDHTIQSLQKIESAVERLSSDTRELIKAGWDKMIGNVDRPMPSIAGDSNAKEVAAGIAAELRSELASLANNSKGSHQDRSQLQTDHLEQYLKNFEASLMAQLKAHQTNVRPSTRLEGLLDTISELSQPTQSLIRAIRNVHLTQNEYKRLSEGRFRDSIVELRRAGLLVPVVHETPDGPEPCYYFPAGVGKSVRAVLQVLPEPPKELQREVADELKRINYPSGDDHPRRQSTEKGPPALR